jgi:hypothetical protein
MPTGVDRQPNPLRSEVHVQTLIQTIPHTMRDVQRFVGHTLVEPRN